MFLDGDSRGILYDNTPIEYYTSQPYDLYIGCQSGNEANFKGVVDEIIISSVQRDPSWIKLCYENQKENQTLVEIQ